MVNFGDIPGENMPEAGQLCQQAFRVVQPALGYRFLGLRQPASLELPVFRAVPAPPALGQVPKNDSDSEGGIE